MSRFRPSNFSTEPFLRKDWTIRPTFGRAPRLPTCAFAAAAAVWVCGAAAWGQSGESVLPIGKVQGDNSGLMEDGFPSPFDGEVVTVQGVVYLPLTRYGREDRLEYGFFIQNTPETTDGTASTSDGIFVYMQRNQRVQMETGGDYIPKVGDEILIKGKVREIMGHSNLTAARVLGVVRRGVDVHAALRPVEVSPPSSHDENARYWESLESMCVVIPAGSIVQGGRIVFGGHEDAIAYLIDPASVPARRTDPHSRRVFRDAHPLDDDAQRFDNDDLYRFQVASLGIKGTTGDPTAILGPLRTFDATTEPIIAAVYQRYQEYTLQVERDLPIRPGPMPMAAPPTPLPRDSHISIASFNVENLYDYRNDPTDDCDFDGDPGNERVSPPFNYVPADDAAYRRHLEEIGQQIVEGLRAPDLIFLQELEDQDIMTVGEDGEVTDGADGRLDALQELAAAIRKSGGPVYENAADRDGADPRGIVCGFLYRTDRVEVLPTDSAGFLFGEDFRLAYPGVPLPSNRDATNPKAVNATLPIDTDLSSGVSGSNVFARAAQVGLFRFRPDASHPETALDVYVINNHFSSRPDQRVGQRKEQARLNAAIATRILEEDPDAAIALGGDLNVFPRPDDPHPDNPSDQLSALYEAGLVNMYDRLLKENPAGAYTYVYRGQAGTLDQLFLSPALHGRLAQTWIGHFNSDWPDNWFEDAPYGASDHDPILASFRVGD